MCGIAGSVNCPLKAMQVTTDLYHRGPDEQTMFYEKNVQLLHCRLSILDAVGGRQPMHLEHLTIIFNGEIYNHIEVRVKHRLECKTNSDTETILAAYAKYGPACLHDFEGMFAFAIYDRQRNEIFIARDRAGKKPVFYFLDGDQFAFSSELNALRNQLQLDIDDDNIQQYLYSGYFYKAATPYQKVHALPAGSYAVVSLDPLSVKITKWWDIHLFYCKSANDDFQSALLKTDRLLHNAVQKRIESSDLEVGAFLSGGIDSGLVTAIAKEYNPGLKTFTVSFQGTYNEAPLAKLVADRYRTNHHEISISFDNVLNDVEQILCNYGQPFFDSSAIPSYYVSREAKKDLTVILNGDGGDELFGGYRRYMPFAKYDFFKSGFLVKKGSSLLYHALPVAHDKQSKYNYLHRLTDFARKSGLHTYFSSTLDIFEGFEKYLIASDHVLENMNMDFEKINRSRLSGLQKIMNLDFDHILSSNLLMKMDIATMSNSLEGRSPFLSSELMEYVPGLPDQYKIEGIQTKYLLRKLAEKYLPAELIHQPKRGFEIPLKEWMDGEFKDLVASYILSPSAYCKGLVHDSFINKLWHRKIKTGDEKRAKMLWLLFTLEVWYQKIYLKK